MDTSYWKKRWQEGNIGWHRPSVHPFLEKFFPAAISNAKTLIPLCGKTVDIDWISAQGNHVTGIDVARNALQAVQKRHPQPWHTSKIDSGHIYALPSVTLIETDFFDWIQTARQSFDWIWDRAAFVAIDPTLRRTYLEGLVNQLKDGHGFIFCVTYQYDQTFSTAPPFSTTPSDMKALCKGLLHPEVMESFVEEGTSNTLSKRGVTKITERLWKLSLDV